MRHNTNIIESKVDTASNEEDIGQNLALSSKLYLLTDVIALYRPGAGIVGYVKNGFKKVVETSVDLGCDQCVVRHPVR